MLGWAIAFILAAVIVGLLGVAETANTFGVLTKVLFWVFLVGFLVSLAMHFRSMRAHGNHR
jgi:uncharacterized membrane protein YtjA (UPF0391 family)